MTCLDCADVFGGERRADPIPEFLEQDDFETAPSPALCRKSFGGIKGLQLDVERMFMETVPVYPHPLKPIEFTQDEVVILVMKVAFRALVEQVCVSRFTLYSYWIPAAASRYCFAATPNPSLYSGRETLGWDERP
jgi:hypothetical protein